MTVAVETDGAFEVADHEPDVVEPLAGQVSQAHHASSSPADPKPGPVTAAQPHRHDVAAEHVGNRLCSLDHLDLVAVHEHGRGPWHGVEVVRTRVLVGARVEEGQHVARRRFGQKRIGQQHVEAAADADDVGGGAGLGVGSCDRHDGPAHAFEVDVGQERLGGVGLDPALRPVRAGSLWCYLPFLLEVDDGRQVQAGVGVQAPPRLELQRDAVRRQAGLLELSPQGRGDAAGVV